MDGSMQTLVGALYRPGPEVMLKRQQANWWEAVCVSMSKISQQVPLDQRFLIEMAAGLTAEEIAESEELPPSMVLQMAADCLNGMTNEAHVIPGDLQSFLGGMDDAEQTIREWLDLARALRVADAPVQLADDERFLLEFAEGYSPATIARWERRPEEEVASAAAERLSLLIGRQVEAEGLVAHLAEIPDAEAQVRELIARSHELVD